MKKYSTAGLCGMVLAAGLSLTIPAYPQIVNGGIKAGFNYSWTHSDDETYRDLYNIRPVPGFNAGIVASFQLKKRYYLHTELLYATKGRIVTGDWGLDDAMVFRYIELPMMYQIHFKSTVGSTRQFHWYAGIGPNFSYWLGGDGTVTNFEITDHDIPSIPYTIKFGERPPEMHSESGLVYIQDARRLQVGINIGGGVMVEPAPNRKFMVDLRFELGHSWLAEAESADYIFPTTYSRNMQSRNMGLRLSVMYMLQTNLDKKVRNKGKSNVIKKGRMIKQKK